MKKKVLGILLTIAMITTSADFTVFATEQTTETEIISEEETSSSSKEDTEKEIELSEIESCELSEESFSEVISTEEVETEESIASEKIEEEFTTLEIKENQIEQEEVTTDEVTETEQEEIITDEETIVDFTSEETTANDVESTAEEIEKKLNSDNSVQSGSYRNITWEIDTNGKLTVSGTGDFSSATGYDRAPWYHYRESITSAVVNVTGMKDASYMFYNCENLARVNLDNFDTSEVINMHCMFSGCSSMIALDVSKFNIENVTNMRGMFERCSSMIVLDVSKFNTENVTDMGWMFDSCSSLTALDISNFNTENITDMRWMFYHCSSLLTLDLSNFNTRNVTNMKGIFCGCSSLTTLDISNFNTENVTDMTSMFYGCSSLTALNISSFNIKNVIDTGGMFYDCSNLIELDMSNFNTENVTDMGGMFGNCSSLEVLDISNFNTENVTDMNSMFEECRSLTVLDVSNFNTGNVTNMCYMFEGCRSLTVLDVSNFNIGNVTNMRGMFWGCSNLTVLDISDFNTENVTNMRTMFWDCSSLIALDISNFNTENVTDMQAMFYGCSSLTVLDISSFNTGNVTDMCYMFKSCSCLKTVDLSNFDTKNVKCVQGMFDGCSNLITLDISNFDLTNTIISNIEPSSMFSDCTMLKTIYAPCNLTFTLPLPIINSTDVWYLSDGTVVTELPQSLSQSVIIKKNEIPTLDTDNFICIGGNINGKGYSYSKVRAIHKEEIIKGRKVKWEFQGYVDTFEDKTDKDGYFFLKSPLLSYNENGSNTFELLASVSYFDGNAWINIPDFYTMKVTVEPMSYSQNWQLKTKANFEAGIGSGVGAEIGPAKAEASMAEVSVAASGGGTIDISHDYEGGKRNLSLRQTLSTEVAAKTKLGPASSLEFANSKAEVTVAGVEGEIAAGGNVTYGITIEDYNPNNMDHLLQVGKFIVTSQMYSSGNVLLAQLLTKSGFDRYGMEGAGISSSLSAGASAMGVEVSNANTNKTYFSGNLASVNYERTYSVGYENNRYNNTTNKKLGISSDVKGGILNFDFKKNNINELSLPDFGSNMQKNVEFNVIKSSDGKLNKIDYTDKTYTSWGVPFYSNTNSNEISFTTEDAKVLQKLEGRSNMQKFKDATNAMFFTETFVNETWKEICECADSVDYIVTKKEESTIDVPISLGLQAGIKVEMGVDLAGSSEKSYEKYKGVTQNDSLRVTAETAYSDTDINNIQISIGELLSEPILAMSNQFNNWLNETIGNIKDGVQAGAAWVGEKIDNAKNWIVHIIHPKQDNSRISSKEVRSFVINTYMPSTTRTVESSGVSMTVGEPYIVYVTDFKIEL